MRIGRWVVCLVLLGGLSAAAQERARPDPGEDAVRLRARAFLEYVVEHGRRAPATQWGAYQHFDGHALAHFALRRDLDRGAALLTGTLDMMERNLSDEDADPRAKWHLADFALMTLLRMWFLYRHADPAPATPHDAHWDRLRRVALGFRWHYGDLTENHNLLHMTGRYLVGQLWSDERARGGHRYSRLRARAREDLQEWSRSWVRRGSLEWGSDIYYNVALLAFLNLYDFADEPAMRDLAKSMLDLLLLDQALDAFAGTTVGASRRTYAAYRIDTRLSPARSLHHVYFGGGRAGFNLNFIGGVLAAATSHYRPGPVITWIATNRADTFSHRATHTIGQFSTRGDHLSKHSWRSPEVLLSVLNSPGGGERFTEQVVQVTLGEEALVFVNQPSLDGTVRSPEWPPEKILALYRQGGRADPPLHPLWVPGNAPPGSPGDIRPGYWQGNHFGPRSYGEGRLAFLIYRIGATHLPHPHVWLPRHAFDEEQHEGPWIFARKGDGYVGLWIPEGYHRTATGTWAGREIVCNGPNAAVLVLAGRARTMDGFRKEALALSPSWEAAALRLSATSLEDGARIDVEHDGGPRRNGVAVSTSGPRLGTPWGALPLGEDRFVLRTPAGDLALGVDLPLPSWTSRVTRRAERVLDDPWILITWLGKRVQSLLGQ